MNKKRSYKKNKANLRIVALRPCCSICKYFVQDWEGYICEKNLEARNTSLCNFFEHDSENPDRPLLKETDLGSK